MDGQTQNQGATHLLSLQLQMTHASLCHEYARTEYAQSVCAIRRGELEDEMAAYHETYEAAKQALSHVNPALATQIEYDLRCEKQLVFSDLQS